MSPAVESVLRLADFRVMKSYFEVRADAASFDRSKLQLGIEIAVLQSNESEDDAAVQLTVNLNAAEEEFRAAGFCGGLTVTGFFNTGALKKSRPDDWEPVLVYNAVTVLFGIIRSDFADLSAASPAGRIVIPTVNVGQILNQQPDEEDADEAGPSD